MPAHPALALARTQAAVVRALVDEFEHTTADGNADLSTRGQLIEELVRLGCLIMDVAAVLKASCPPEAVPASQAPCPGVGGAP